MDLKRIAGEIVADPHFVFPKNYDIAMTTPLLRVIGARFGSRL